MQNVQISLPLLRPSVQPGGAASPKAGDTGTASAEAALFAQHFAQAAAGPATALPDDLPAEMPVAGSEPEKEGQKAGEDDAESLQPEMLLTAEALIALSEKALERQFVATDAVETPQPGRGVSTVADRASQNAPAIGASDPVDAAGAAIATWFPVKPVAAPLQGDQPVPAAVVAPPVVPAEASKVPGGFDIPEKKEAPPAAALPEGTEMARSSGEPARGPAARVTEPFSVAAPAPGAVAVKDTVVHHALPTEALRPAGIAVTKPRSASIAAAAVDAPQNVDVKPAETRQPGPFIAPPEDAAGKELKSFARMPAAESSAEVANPRPASVFNVMPAVIAETPEMTVEIRTVTEAATRAKAGEAGEIATWNSGLKDAGIVPHAAPSSPTMVTPAVAFSAEAPKGPAPSTPDSESESDAETTRPMTGIFEKAPLPPLAAGTRPDFAASLADRSAPPAQVDPEGGSAGAIGFPHQPAAAREVTPHHAIPPRSLLPPQIPAQLSQAIITASGPVTELQLSPEELGSVRIELTTERERVSVLLLAERPETLDLLRRHADRLMAEFRAAGFSEMNLGFGNLNPGEQGGDQEGQRPTAWEGIASLPEAAPEAAMPPSRINSQISLYLRL